MRNEQPRFALVAWPGQGDQAPCCITLEALPNAVERGALLVATEADLLPVMMFNAPRLRTEDHEDGA